MASRGLALITLGKREAWTLLRLKFPRASRSRFSTTTGLRTTTGHFQVILENLSPGNVLGMAKSTEVRILDDERPGSLDLDFQLSPELSDVLGFTAAPQSDGT